MKAQVTINTAKICYDTNDGRVLQLEGAIQASMSLSIAASSPLSDENCFPWTILAATFDFADSEGECWRITSRFGSGLLIRTLMDFSSMGRITVWDELALEVREDFEKKVVLRDIWFSSDDRFIRPLIVGDSVREVQFKYFGVSFDLAVFPKEISDDLHLVDVFARTTEPMIDYEAEELPSLYFPVDWRYFLVNSCCMETGASSLPIPFVAERVPQTAKPQPNVVVTSAEALGSGP